MTHPSLEQELKTSKRVYLALLALTIATVAASLWEPVRLLAVVVALTLASIKAALIAWYFMHMSSERPVVWVVMLTGIVAVVILAIGIFPDMAWRLQ